MIKPASVAACRRSLHAFLGQCEIPSEAGGLDKFVPSETQKPILDLLTQSGLGEPGPSLIINKPRQAQTSTAVLGWLLREVEYTPGLMAMMIANTDSTNQELWDRLRGMHSSQPNSIRVSTLQNAAKTLQFSHQGKITVATAKGENPGLGKGLDRLHCSEFGFWPNAKSILSKIFPALVKRKQARIIVESTPGKHGGAYHDLWMRSLSGRTAFTPLFIPWMRYQSYTRSIEGFNPDQSELKFALRYANKYPELSMGHLAFRRHVIATSCDDDERLFDHYYPPDEVTGWLTSKNQSFDPDLLTPFLEEAHEDRNLQLGQGWEPVDPEDNYWIFVDPNGYGGGSGDPSAVSIWSQAHRREVASWSKRIDPELLGRQLAKVGKYWNTATIVVESNSAACIASLRATEYPKVWSSGNKEHPGYYRTHSAKERAFSRLVRQLRDGMLHFRSKPAILQMLAWDGSDTRETEEGEKHHWDRVVVAQMVGDIFFDLPKAPSKVEPLPPGAIPVPKFVPTRSQEII